MFWFVVWLKLLLVLMFIKKVYGSVWRKIFSIYTQYIKPFLSRSFSSLTCQRSPGRVSPCSWSVLRWTLCGSVSGGPLVLPRCPRTRPQRRNQPLLPPRGRGPPLSMPAPSLAPGEEDEWRQQHALYSVRPLPLPLPAGEVLRKSWAPTFLAVIGHQLVLASNLLLSNPQL